MLPLCAGRLSASPRYAGIWSTRLLIFRRRRMADLLFLALGGGAFVAFAVLVHALKRIG